MYDVYELTYGEKLDDVAKKFNTDVNTLKDINNITYDMDLRAGMDLIVPKKSNSYFEYYTIKQGDTLYQIAKKYNINPDLLSHLNGLKIEDYIYPGQVILIPKSGYSFYVTIAGDTLDGVAKTFNMSVSDVIKNN